MDDNTSFSRKGKGGFIDPSSLPRNEHNLPMCRWCSHGVKPPRRTFCSQTCAHEHMLRTNPSYMRKQCFERDKGICKSCNIDTKKTAQEIRSLEKIINPIKVGKMGRRKHILITTEDSIKFVKHIILLQNGKFI